MKTLNCFPKYNKTFLKFPFDIVNNGEFLYLDVYNDKIPNPKHEKRTLFLFYLYAYEKYGNLLWTEPDDAANDTFCLIKVLKNIYSDHSNNWLRKPYYRKVLGI